MIFICNRYNFLLNLNLHDKASDWQCLAVLTQTNSWIHAFTVSIHDDSIPTVLTQASFDDDSIPTVLTQASFHDDSIPTVLTQASFHDDSIPTDSGIDS
ncbi:hypothetical protein RRG08_007703 [Elysia crispata]|uniref:Uncharacterized protein n=1 Tax=Elysia crispata TaxID=231223 RepID=A0AAE0YUV9_9GAST|nr:hypothetical protein RRG08_007703 [Elysia crispata]